MFNFMLLIITVLYNYNYNYSKVNVSFSRLSNNSIVIKILLYNAKLKILSIYNFNSCNIIE